MRGDCEQMWEKATMSYYEPRLGVAPEAQKMRSRALESLHDWKSTHMREPSEIRCSFATVATCALPIAIKRHETERRDGEYPPTLLAIPLLIDDLMPYGMFTFVSERESVATGEDE